MNYVGKAPGWLADASNSEVITIPQSKNANTQTFKKPSLRMARKQLRVQIVLKDFRKNPEKKEPLHTTRDKERRHKSKKQAQAPVFLLVPLYVLGLMPGG